VCVSACVCAYHCEQLPYTTQHRAVLIISLLILQTRIRAQMLSLGGEEEDRSYYVADNSNGSNTTICENKHVSNVINLTKDCFPSCHPLQLQTDLSDLDPSNTLFLGPTSDQNCISIGSASSAGLTFT